MAGLIVCTIRVTQTDREMVEPEAEAVAAAAEEKGLLRDAQHRDIMAAMLQRMQVEVEKAAKEGKVNQMYTPESIQQRIDLLSDPTIQQALEDLWQARIRRCMLCQCTVRMRCAHAVCAHTHCTFGLAVAGRQHGRRGRCHRQV